MHRHPLVGLPGLGHRTPDALSGGQRRRVALARAIALEPEIVFFDEPTSGLDPNLEEKMMVLLREMTLRGKTVATVTHTLDSQRGFVSELSTAPPPPKAPALHAVVAPGTVTEPEIDPEQDDGANHGRQANKFFNHAFSPYIPSSAACALRCIDAGRCPIGCKILILLFFLI